VKKINLNHLTFRLQIRKELFEVHSKVLQHSHPGRLSKTPTQDIFITTKLLDLVHHPDFYKQKTQRFGNWICFRLQARGGTNSTEKPKACLSTGDARTEERVVTMVCNTHHY
jgi:hypothetical protein